MTLIEVGQRWRSKDGRRTVEVTAYEPEWADVSYRNLSTGRAGDIFAVNLRTNYELVDA